MSSPQITYASLTSDVPSEAAVLAHVYKLVLDCHAKKEAAPESRPDARKENPNASGKPSIPRAS